MNVPFLDLKRQYRRLQDEIEATVTEVLRSTAYIGGAYVKQLEDKAADYLGCSHAIGCGNGTDALVLALRACDVRPGDEVITTPFTFFATAEAIASLGAIPVFVDIKENDYNIDPSLIEKEITDKTKAILPVHIFGAACDMDAIMEIAARYHLKVIEDTAQGIGGEYKGKKLGTIGDIGCFSFYPTKNLGACGDGGMVTTNNEDLGTILRALHEHGAGEFGARASTLLGGIEGETDCLEEGTELYNPYKYYNYLIGYNSRLDAIQAAILSIKMNHLNEFNEKRAGIARRYYEGLSDHIRKPRYDHEVKNCWHQFVICTERKPELCKFLSEKGIGNGTFYPVPLHKQKAFVTGTYRIASDGLPVSELISGQSVCLPIFPEMTDEEVQFVIETCNRFYEE